MQTRNELKNYLNWFELIQISFVHSIVSYSDMFIIVTKLYSKVFRKKTYFYKVLKMLIVTFSGLAEHTVIFLSFLYFKVLQYWEIFNKKYI